VAGGTASTGLLLGGFTVAAHTLMRRMKGSALLVTSMELFIVGSRHLGLLRELGLARAAGFLIETQRD
jgi:hypothetical protein